MVESIVHSLGKLKLPNEWITIIVAALPVIELRGAIPLAAAMKFSIHKAFFLSVIGNMLPVVPLLLFLEPVSNRLRKIPLFYRFFDWLFTRTRARAKLVERFEFLGLMLLVAIPLPMTGAWTGCIAASLLKVDLKIAVLAIFAGVVIAGIIVSILTILGAGLI
ncbi:MAG: small multi-drug export protein [Candidatus Omnitrophota bacterium]